MAPSNKDPRRPDLIVPYQEPKTKGESAEMGNAMTSTLPMAAMFTRNKYIGWTAVIISLQSWLGESEDTKKNSATPGYLNVFLAVMATSVSYLPLFMPPPNRGSSTAAAPAPVPAA